MIQEKSDNKPVSLSVGIIGCGWLGKALADSLLPAGKLVLATSSKQENIEKLNQLGIKAQQLTLPTDDKQFSQHDVFAQQSLVIAITPKFKQGQTDYADKIAQVVHAAQQRGLVQRIILLSSTAVYQGLTGKIDEQSALNLTSQKAQMLKAAEQAVLDFSKHLSKHVSNQGVVLRLAGLVGPERHPGKFLLASKTLTNAKAPVNLIHQQDAVGLIESLLSAESAEGIFNGVSDTHVSKEQYYQAAAKSLSLPTPDFSPHQSDEITRVVCGEKAKQRLNYKFIYPDLLSWL